MLAQIQRHCSMKNTEQPFTLTKMGAHSTDENQTRKPHWASLFFAEIHIFFFLDHQKTKVETLGLTN